MIEQGLVQAVLASAQRAREEAKKDLGRATELRCSCGGPLHEDAGVQRRLVKLAEGSAGPKPRHRKKRILKKRMKVWRLKVVVGLRMYGPLMLRRPGFICGACGERLGWYQAIVRNMFRVEPLPPGAVLVNRTEF